MAMKRFTFVLAIIVAATLPVVAQVKFTPSAEKIDVEIDGKGSTHASILKEYQVDPLKGGLLHADFLRLSKDAKVHVEVPVLFVNELASPGLKRGGVLNIVRHELELVCESDKIPDDIQIDVTGLDIGDSIHISSVKLPEGAASGITDRDFTIATIVAPSGLRSEEGDNSKAETEA